MSSSAPRSLPHHAYPSPPRLPTDPPHPAHSSTPSTTSVPRHEPSASESVPRASPSVNFDPSPSAEASYTPATHEKRVSDLQKNLATPPRPLTQTPTPDHTPPSSATLSSMSNASQANGSTSPKRTFDPFAPLPSSQPPSAPYDSAGSFSKPTISTTAAPPSFASHSAGPSVSRAPRPSSLYIPMDDSRKKPTATDITPTWPFSGANGNNASLGVQQPYDGATPLSPSEIHPSYADSPNAAALHQSPPMPSDPPQKLYSAIPMSAASEGSDAAYSSSSFRGVSRTPSPNVAAKGRGAHLSQYSLSTHALLSTRQPSAAATLAERFDTPTAWLVLYFGFNLGLTLFNKLVLQGFPFPWTLTAIQMLSGTIGTQIALQRGFFTQARLTTKENGIMIMFSGLYTINIAVSNLSLHLVSVPFHQVVRAMTPLFTIVISIILYRKRHSQKTYLSLVPVVMGVVFATYGDYSFTAWGFILTLLGTLLAALKTIITNRVQVGRLKLHPLDLLVRMSPLAFMQCVFFGWWSGELDRVREYGATEMTRHKAIALAVNGAIAFGLNVVSFTANKKTSALTMTVAANVKQVLTIVLAVLIFNVALNPTNVLGISLTLAGGAWYASVELQEKTARAAAAAASAPRPAPEGEKLG